MIFTDTHTHLYSDAFEEDQEQMMQRAFAAGVKRFFIPAIDASYANAMFALENTYPENVYLMMGLHPTSVKENYKEELAFVENQFQQRNFFAVGEIGIDLFWDTTTLAKQQDAFRKQIHLAKRYNLPIVIHCREAFNEIFEILEEEKAPDLFGIFHCFTGTFEQAKKAISFNMKLGIGGVVTFKNGKIDQFLKQIPIKNIVLETDAPYLSPVPFRGKRNESSYIVNIAKKVSEIYEIPLEVVAAITTQNSKDIFSK
ncbi:MAG: hydrolase TatD [Flavobacteriaceae bacterium CG_4_8_14_3_um_filter_34_10]|nr:TatD family hydrolase [Flavobacteriia bacterium]PIQ17402.1 MAG: hydrolase TatD [Flavobacteriaceae bacterium CG18_big_fil_WC_8_21_14_2_50_34_36]PIV50395.1 MAG: hydrolase TatD [Flavobacteriaceae bacterium CG02_land_8_20_14_3_00_34_13]PIX09924.1 MAG: hydrolase TatD [Flavobacteriaceae bacterium CG_4_8_14_3_um_filter_34_10]PIZ08990.1 MAG: hydrolase TatD [Flavobacteriaceae bacterium CG_4_10_14_0_8_um_filter_34_31]PJC08607.1 MAG: hydrolase TatD [Flavobacteriaceae bacterium CG_4_9_14_0_8_um_filter_